LAAGKAQIVEEEAIESNREDFPQSQLTCRVSREEFETEDSQFVEDWVQSSPENNALRKIVADTSHDLAPKGRGESYQKKLEVIFALCKVSPSQGVSWVSYIWEQCSKIDIAQVYGFLDVAICCLRVLTAVCDGSNTNEKAQAYADGMSTIDKILAEARHRDVFTSVFEEDSINGLGQKGIILEVLESMNIWCDDAFTFNDDDTEDTEPRALKDVLFGRGREHVGSYSTTFRTDGLDIYSLQQFGKLKIKWTNRCDRHLNLNLGDSADDDSMGSFSSDELKPTLYIFWFETEALSSLSR
jgi:hypothetical protein